MAAIDNVLPRYDAREVHSVPLALPPDRALELALTTPVGADPLVRALFRLRGLKARGTIADALVRVGLTELARGEGEVVFGGSGKPWRPAAPVGSFAEAAPGSVRIVTDFRSDGVSLTTETRVAATNAAARRSFERYWRVVGPFSALIRHRWLRQIAKRAP